jgi:hypothetical protein
MHMLEEIGGGVPATKSQLTEATSADGYESFAGEHGTDPGSGVR